MKHLSWIVMTAVLIAGFSGTAFSRTKFAITIPSRPAIVKPKPAPTQLVIDFTPEGFTLSPEDRAFLLSHPVVRAAVEEEAKKISDAELQALDQCLDRVSQTGECANAQDYLECAVEVCSRT